MLKSKERVPFLQNEIFLSPSSPVSSLTPSSGTSDELDHQEAKLALHDAKAASRNKIRSRFHSSSDLIHRLFVCISGKLSFCYVTLFCVSLCFFGLIFLT